MNMQEALEWAADFAERYKLWPEGAIDPAVRLDVIKTLALLPLEYKKREPNWYMLKRALEELRNFKENYVRNTNEVNQMTRIIDNIVRFMPEELPPEDKS